MCDERKESVNVLNWGDVGRVVKGALLFSASPLCLCFQRPCACRGRLVLQWVVWWTVSLQHSRLGAMEGLRNVEPSVFLREFRKTCATPVMLLRHTAQAMATEMQEGLDNPGQRRLKMLPTYLECLPSGCVVCPNWIFLPS